MYFKKDQIISVSCQKIQNGARSRPRSLMNLGLFFLINLIFLQLFSILERIYSIDNYLLWFLWKILLFCEFRWHFKGPEAEVEAGHFCFLVPMTSSQKNLKIRDIDPKFLKINFTNGFVMKFCVKMMCFDEIILSKSWKKTTSGFGIQGDGSEWQVNKELIENKG